MNTTRRSLFAAAVAFGARCFGRAAWPTGGDVHKDQLAEQTDRIRAARAQSAGLRTITGEPITVNGSVRVRAWSRDCGDDFHVELVHIESALAEGKPEMDKDGKAWRRIRTDGSIGYDANGRVYWLSLPFMVADAGRDPMWERICHREGDGPWERV